MKKIILFICLGLSVSTQAMLRVGARRVLPAAVRSLSTKPCTKETVQEDIAEIEEKIKKDGKSVEGWTNITVWQLSILGLATLTMPEEIELWRALAVINVAPLAMGGVWSSGQYLRHGRQLKKLRKQHSSLNEE